MRIHRIERIREQSDQHGSARWLIGFTDLTTLLLAFFILLFSTAQVRKTAWHHASQSMRASFSAREQTEPAGQPGEAKADKTWTSMQRNPGLDLTYLDSLVRKRLASERELSGLEVAMADDHILISLPADTSFQAGDDRLSPDGEHIVSHLAQFFAQLPNQVEIIGHADPSLVDGQKRFGTNWHLSLARANAVAVALRQDGYAGPVLIRGRGAADSAALPKNLPDDARNEKARRVDFRLYMLQP